MLTLWLSLLTLTASADDDAYLACCRAAGADTCPHTVRLVSNESRIAGDLVVGLWTVSCKDEISWDAGARAVVPAAAPGRLVGALPPAAYACFDAACPMPSALCISPNDGANAEVHTCGSHAAPSSTDVRSPRMPRTAVVVGPGQVVTAVLQPPGRRAAPPSSTAAPSTAPVRTAHAVPPSPPPVVRSRPPAVASAPTPQRVDPVTPPPMAARATPSVRTASPTPPPARAQPPVVALTAAFELPPAPPDPCRPSADRRQASNDQVAMGDEARVARDPDTALGHYRAALLVESCNGYAWASTGTLLLSAERWNEAASALSYATRLQPNLTRAWVELGTARERLGDVRGAVTAYTRALHLQPGQPIAEERLLRITGRR